MINIIGSAMVALTGAVIGLLPPAQCDPVYPSCWDNPTVACADPGAHEGIFIYDERSALNEQVIPSCINSKDRKPCFTYYIIDGHRYYEVH